MFEEGMYSEPGRPNVPLDVINSIVHNIFLSKFCFLVGQPNFIIHHAPLINQVEVYNTIGLT